MNRLDVFLQEDRTLPDRLASAADRSARIELITESIASGVAAMDGATDRTAVANAMLAVATSHVLGAEESGTPREAESHARQGAAWAARAVRAAGDDPGPILYFVPRAATLVTGGLGYVPEADRRDWLDRLDGWALRVTEALGRQPAAAGEGTRDLIVGLTLLEATADAQPSEVPKLQAAAAPILEDAKASLAVAGESELVAEAERVLRTIG